MFIRILKYTTFLTASGALIGSAYNHNWNISNIGLVRFGRASYTVSSIALDYKFSLRNLTDNSPESEKMWSTIHERSANKLLNLCCKNGGVFIKVGQHIATLEYIVPKEYCKVLSTLHSKCPKTNINDVKKVIKEDLKKDQKELFVNFTEEPLGTASLAQVHKATLKNGKVLAVKVQHPLAKAHSLIDIATMDFLVHAVAKIFPEFSFLWLAEEMKINLPIELDFIQEGQNAEKVSKMFSHLKWLKIPKIIWELSSSRVLTMEFIDGGEVTDRQYMAKNKINVRTISKLLGLLYSEMIFVKGYVHCDPHPGNILVKNNNGQVQIILLDHGLYTVMLILIVTICLLIFVQLNIYFFKTLPENFRHNYSQFWLSILNSDINGIKEWGKKLGVKDLAPLLACLLTSRTWETIVTGLHKEQSIENKKAEVRFKLTIVKPRFNSNLI